MSGTSAPNKPVFYRSITAINIRVGELGVAAIQFINGCNRGVASGGIGPNTGGYNPKATDVAHDSNWSGVTSYIGQREQAIASKGTRLWGLPNDTEDQLSEQAVSLGFNSAASDTDPDAIYGDGIVLSNKTGTVMPSGAWAWGFEAEGGTLVPPTGDAGGPYTFTAIDGKTDYEIVQINATVTPGTDPEPTYYWAIVDGIPDNERTIWTDRDTLSPTIKPGAFHMKTGDVIILALIIKTADTPTVTAFAQLTYVGP